jgi:outer membrane murein-binding lipoprotein Lpp
VSDEPKVEIGLREIYDTVLEVATGVRTLNERVGKLEDNARKSDEIDEVSRDALQKAKQALFRLDKMDAHITWLWRSIVGAIIALGIAYLSTHLR